MNIHAERTTFFTSAPKAQGTAECKRLAAVLVDFHTTQVRMHSPDNGQGRAILEVTVLVANPELVARVRAAIEGA